MNRIKTSDEPIEAVEKVGKQIEEWLKDKSIEKSSWLLFSLSILKLLIGIQRFNECTYFCKVERECSKIIEDDINKSKRERK